MEFSSVLNEYLYRLDCTAKTLAAAAGVSEIQLSRWRNGARRPSPEKIRLLAEGISRLSDGDFSADEVARELFETLPAPQRTQDGVGRRVDLLLDAVKIHTSEAARVLNFDPSYLSRIRSGKRNPSNTEPIIEGISRYVARRCVCESDRSAVAALIGTESAELADAETYRAALDAWLRGGSAHPLSAAADMSGLFRTMDDFDLNEYIQAIRFDGTKPSPDAPPPVQRTVSGLKNMMHCELDFFRATELSDSDEHVFIYSDMPLTELAKDPDFPKQWMLALAELIRKGLDVDMLHNVERPFEEMLLGLEIHIPIYMTGRIHPYYLRETNSGPFRHLLEVSGGVALSGEAVSGHHAEGRYRLVTDDEEVRYYRARADALMEKASPLMDIYTEEQDLEDFLDREAAHGCMPVQLDMPAFRNIRVQICHERWAIVTKERSPRVSFVIRHPKLVDAIERFAAPLVDEETL